MTAIGRTGFIPNSGIKIYAPHLIRPEDISIVIPVKDNQKGIDNFLSKFEALGDENLGLKEIIIVDNNSQIPIVVNHSVKISLKIIFCEDAGPAAARNRGIKEAKGEWILFMDSDCEMTKSTIHGYLRSSNGSVAYAGGVVPSRNDLISKYYISQKILIPPQVNTNNSNSPEYLITANCLIWKKVLERLEGFNENIRIAAGEDIDMGFRIREVGYISFALDSHIIHHFETGLIPFIKRFYRYGLGNRYLSDLYKVDMCPKPFHPVHRNLVNYFLGFIQWVAMLLGYSGVMRRETMISSEV